MTSLNCPDEVYLANKLINIHPWADMVKFTRSGGEANAVAIRVARCSTSRHKVAICGYHGWHDWYISANINKTDKLSNHLLEGIGHLGVPDFLEKTVCPRIVSISQFDILKKYVIMSVPSCKTYNLL